MKSLFLLILLFTTSKSASAIDGNYEMVKVHKMQCGYWFYDNKVKMYLVYNLPHIHKTEWWSRQKNEPQIPTVLDNIKIVVLYNEDTNIYGEVVEEYLEAWQIDSLRKSKASMLNYK